MKILLTICARGGSKGVPSKNIRPLLGKPLILHTIEQAKAWGKASQIIVSSDSQQILDVARQAGIEVPFVRPTELATDAAGKVPVITHALKEAERVFNTQYDLIVDLDPTCPVRRAQDIELGFQTSLKSNAAVCFSVTRGRKSPYFNIVERDDNETVKICKKLEKPLLARQQAPKTWDINGSVYVYKRDFLLSNPQSVLDGKVEIFETPPETAFDIDEERDFILVEAMMKYFLTQT